jgi:hypothetical protein
MLKLKSIILSRVRTFIYVLLNIFSLKQNMYIFVQNVTIHFIREIGI